MNVLIAADTGGGYVAAAFLVFIIVLLIYVALMANKLAKMQKSLSEGQQKNSDAPD
ncbi:MAG: hypothetical protein JHD02_03475 [Thermoleophilaceae bacterium]|nr:hypothetical protein [Thermoleophilaceae bacterium]